MNVPRAAFMCLGLASATLAGAPAVRAQQSQPCTEDAMIVFDASKSMAAAAGDNTGLRRIDSVRPLLPALIAPPTKSAWILSKPHRPAA